MNNNDSIYRDLQRHLNRQAVGFPATRSKAELAVLKHIFSPEQAKIAMGLTYKFQTLDAIYAHVGSQVDSIDRLEQSLDQMQKKGGLLSAYKNGIRQYCLVPLIVGMYELQLNRLSPEFLKSFKAYTNTLTFSLEFLNTKRSQMRTIPVEKSISVRHHVLPYDHINQLLQQAEPPFVIMECLCRKKKEMEGFECSVTHRNETCMAIGDMGQSVLKSGIGREISRDEAATILEQNQQEGLVLQPSNTEQVEFICSCCGCCCGMLGMQKHLPEPLKFWESNYYAFVDAAACTGCGRCETRCQVAAIHANESQKMAIVDLKRCLGCGVCVVGCHKNAITLVRKEKFTCPPKTMQALYDDIRASRGGRLKKIELAGSIIVDAVRTRQRHLLK